MTEFLMDIILGMCTKVNIPVLYLSHKDEIKTRNGKEMRMNSSERHIIADSIIRGVVKRRG